MVSSHFGHKWGVEFSQFGHKFGFSAIVLNKACLVEASFSSLSIRAMNTMHFNIALN